MKKTSLLIAITVGIVLVMIIAYCSRTTPHPLTKAATELVMSSWGTCGPGTCQTLTVRVLDDEEGKTLVEALYENMADDSVDDVRKTAEVIEENGTVRLGPILRHEWTCQPGRGQQEFSTELCL